MNGMSPLWHPVWVPLMTFSVCSYGSLEMPQRVASSFEASLGVLAPNSRVPAPFEAGVLALSEKGLGISDSISEPDGAFGKANEGISSQPAGLHCLLVHTNS